MREPPGTRADYVAFRQHTTRWNDNDTYGHLNNAVHYQLFDSAVNEWLIRAKILHPGRNTEIGLVAETGCRYYAEMAYPQIITSGLRVARLGTSSVRYEIGLFPDDQETAAAEGFFVHVHVQAASHRPCPIPAPVRAALKGLVMGG